MNIYELLDKQNEIRSSIQALVADKTELTEDETRSIEGFEAEIKDIDSKIADLKAENERAKPVNANKITVLTSSKTISDPTFDIKTRSFEETMQYMEKRALTTSSSANLGVDLNPNFVAALAELNPIRKLAKKIVTTNPGRIPFFSAAPSFAITAEGTASPTNDATLSMINFDAYAYPNTQYISKELYSDAAFDILSGVDQMAALGLTSAEIPAFFSGTGVGQPQGILVGGTLGVTAASVSTFTAAELLTLKTKLPPQYRTGKEAFIMSQTAEAIARTLVYPGTQIPMWDPVTGKLLGLDVYVSAFMPAVATGNKTIVLANFDYGYMYVVRKVNGSEMERNFFAEPWNRRYGVLYEERLDAKVLIPTAIQYLKQA